MKKPDHLKNQCGKFSLQTKLTWLILLAVTCLHAQTAPICNTPANGSDWTYLGPFSPPTPGVGARPANTGTGAQIRVKFPNPNDPDPQELYAATPTGGLFRTRNVLDSVPVWENLTDSSRLPVLGVQDFEFEPGNPAVIYAGAGIRYPLNMRREYGIGLLKSTDGGRSWNETGLTFQPGRSEDDVCHEILIHPKNPDTIHVLCGKNYYRSTDGAATFKLLKSNLKTAFRDITFNSGDPSMLYLTTDGGSFFISKNSGENWEELTLLDLGLTEAVNRMDIAVSQRNPDLIYLGAAGKNEIVLCSGDAGETWQEVFKRPLTTSIEKHSFAISPNDDSVLYIGGVYLSQLTVTDSIAKEQRIATYEIHADHRDLTVVSDSSGHDIVYSANDGGLYQGVFKDQKWQWTDVSGIGFNNMQFYGIAVAEDFSAVPGGTQDLGTMLIYRDGKATKPNLGGDGTDCAVDPYDPNFMYGISWSISPPVIYRSKDGGMHWARCNQGMASTGDTYFHPLIFHENGYLYAGTKKVERLPYKADTWEQVGDLQLSTENPYRVTAMAVAPSNPNVIYAYGDQLYKTENANAPISEVSWQALGENIGDAAKPGRGGGIIHAVEVDADDPDRVWIGFKTFDSPYKIYFSANGGETWENVSQGLPPFPVNSLAFQAGTDDALYAGTDVGIFYNPRASDPESEWLCFNNGLPVCLVSDLEMNYCFGKIVAGTFGRGIWESPFASPSDFETLAARRDATWSFKIFRSDVVVEKGTTLTLQGEIRIASGKKIIVEKGATLILDGARLKDLCGGAWGGIVTEEGSPRFLGLFFGADPGKVELRNGAVVEGANP